MPKSALTPASIAATISEAAEKIRDAGNQDLAGRLILAGASISISNDNAVIRTLVSSLVTECRAASTILQLALGVLTTEQKHELARLVAAKDLIGRSEGTTRQFERATVVDRAECFLYVTNVPSVLH